MVSLSYLLPFVVGLSLGSWPYGPPGPGFYDAYCNADPHVHAIQPLSTADVERVSSLVQVQVLLRHGARQSTQRWDQMFPYYQSAFPQTFECGGIREVSYHFKNGKVMNYVGLEMNYNDDPLFETLDCEEGQSIDTTFTQGEAVADNIYEAYGTNANFPLFDTSDTILDITDIHTTDYDRTMGTSRAVMTGLLKQHTLAIGDSNSGSSSTSGSSDESSEDTTDYSKTTVNTFIYFLDNDPWNPQDSPECPLFNTWRRTLGEASQEHQTLDTAQWSIDARVNWEAETGSRLRRGFATRTLPAYCQGEFIPVSPNTFTEGMKYSYAYNSALRSNGENSRYVAQLGFGPAVKVIKDYILDLIDDGNGQKLVIYTTHDRTLHGVYEALGIHDGVQPNFAEATMLEIYESSETGIDYWFRFNRNGEFVAAPYCDYSSGTELCDLQVLLNDMWYTLDMDTWEDVCDEITQDVTHVFTEADIP